MPAVGIQHGNGQRADPRAHRIGSRGVNRTAVDGEDLRGLLAGRIAGPDRADRPPVVQAVAPGQGRRRGPGLLVRERPLPRVQLADAACEPTRLPGRPVCRADAVSRRSARGYLAAGIARRGTVGTATDVEQDRADDVDRLNPDALRADALVALARDAVSGAAPAGGGDPVEMVVHVDVETLAGDQLKSTGEISDGPALAPEALRRLGCDAAVVRILERDGAALFVSPPARARGRFPRRARRTGRRGGSIPPPRWPGRTAGGSVPRGGGRVDRAAASSPWHQRRRPHVHAAFGW